MPGQPAPDAGAQRRAAVKDWIAGAAHAPLRGVLCAPGDKSVSHRAIMLGALAEGTSTIRGFLEGADTRATAAIFAALGVRIEAPEDGVRIVHGVGLHGLRGVDWALDCGNAGTAMRLIAGVLAGQAFSSTLIGDASLMRRPMARVVDPLRAMGARITASDTGTPPLRMLPAHLTGQSFAPPIASAQVKSALLLAGLYAQGSTRVEEPHPTRDYTERMLAAFGWPVRYGAGWAELDGGHRLHAADLHVPGDFSSAAFAIVAALVVPGSEIEIRDVGLDARRTGLLRALTLMGAQIEVGSAPDEMGRVRVCASPLHGIDVPEALVPDMIDEFPALFAAAALSEGVTRVRGAAELRVKESDRIARMASALRALGVRVDETADGADIHGKAGAPLRGGEVDSAGDHRIAMASAVLAQCTSAPVRISDVANVATSYPGFARAMQALGFNISATAG